MRKEIGCGLRTIVMLITIYAMEMVILSLIYRFLSRVPYHFIAPPVVILAMAGAWLAIYVGMQKRGER
jgi:hypothetical protein